MHFNSSPDRGDAFDNFARFQGSGQQPAAATAVVNPNDNDEYYDDDEEDDDMNFEPQNGYADEEDMDFEDGPEIEIKKPKKERYYETISFEGVKTIMISFVALKETKNDY